MQKSEVILNLVILILDVAVLVMMLLNLFETGEKPIIVTSSVNLVLCAAVIAYGVYGFEVPHGNALKYVILLFALGIGAEIFINQGISKVCLALMLTACALAAYTSGRLGKRTNAVILFSVVAALLLAAIIYERVAPPPAGIMNDPAILGVPGSEVGSTPLPEVPAGDKPAGFSALSVGIGRLLLWITTGVTYFARYKAHKEAGAVEDADA